MAIAEHLSKGDERVAKPSGRRCSLTGDQVAHWQWLLVYSVSWACELKKEREIRLVLFSPCFIFLWLTDWLTSIVIAPWLTVISTHTSLRAFRGWTAATCVSSAWGRCPRVCVSQITFTRRCSSRLLAPALSHYHIKDLDVVKFRLGETVQGLERMTDVKLVTLGIIRCYTGDSLKCKIAFEHGEGNGRQFDST